MHRPLLLSGFMATGKTTVGRRVAELAGVPFDDLDARVERRAGSSVAQIFRDHGEARFRELERAELGELLADPTPRVVALGGGTLIARATRLAALEQAVVATLSAPVETLAQRTADDATRPLLAGGDPAARLAELLELRAPAYAEAHAVVDTSAGDLDAAARAVLDVWRRDPIAVAAGARSYAVDVSAEIAAPRLASWLRGATSALLVSDDNVAPLHAARLDPAFAEAGVRRSLVCLAPGEPAKNLASLEKLWRTALDAELDRQGAVVALGGGVTTDIAGLAAATWMRGVRWMPIPTTLLAMVDASVGGKTAIDLAHAKNAVGAFWQPSAVVCDIALLATEPERGYVSALSEVVKSALIGDAALLELLEQRADAVLAREPEVLGEVVRRSVAVKARVVSRDEREGGLRATLNLGHTVGHALEAHAGYALLSHGEAVSLGLVAALRIGTRLGTTPRALAERVEALLRRLGLPVDIAARPLAEAASRLGHDKKRAGARLRFIVARAPGDVTHIDLPIATLREHVIALA